MINVIATYVLIMLTAYNLGKQFGENLGWAAFGLLVLIDCWIGKDDA